MKKSRLLGAVIFLLALNVNAAVIDFEEFQSSAPLDVSVIGGLEFSRCVYPVGSSSCVRTGIGVFDVSSLYGHINLASSGVMGAHVSNEMSIRTVDGSSFDFLSAYFGMTHPDGEYDVNILEGMRDGQVVYSSVNIIPKSPRHEANLYQFDWRSIDEVRVSSYYNGGYFVIDDIQYSISAVPLPPALWLFSSGLLGLIGIAKKKADQQQ